MESAFNPAEYLRGFSDEQIVDHLVATLKIFQEIRERTDVPEILHKDVFAVAQAMRAAMQPRNQPSRLTRVG